MALPCSHEAIEDAEQRQYTACISIYKVNIISYIIVYCQFWFVLKDENLLLLSHTNTKNKKS